MPTMTIRPKVDATGKNIPGRFVASLTPKRYVSKLLRGSIELPGEQTRRAKAAEKRARKAAQRSA